MKMRIYGARVCVAIALAIAGCGGGGQSVASLQGTWSGTVENPSDALGRITLVFDNGGHFTVTSPDGSSTGTAKEEKDNVFSYKLSDGTSGGFMVDDAGNHAGFVDENFYFGVVQKDASSALPGFTPPDVVGNWSGMTVELGSDLSLQRMYGSSATVSSNGAFSGENEKGSFVGAFADYNPAYGRFRGGATQGGYSMYVSVFLTADKSFAAGYGCAKSGTFPADCGFTLWHK